MAHLVGVALVHRLCRQAVGGSAGNRSIQQASYNGGGKASTKHSLQPRAGERRPGFPPLPQAQLCCPSGQAAGAGAAHLNCSRSVFTARSGLQGPMTPPTESGAPQRLVRTAGEQEVVVGHGGWLLGLQDAAAGRALASMTSAAGVDVLMAALLELPGAP